jgi:hypothetical protein
MGYVYMQAMWRDYKRYITYATEDSKLFKLEETVTQS